MDYPSGDLCLARVHGYEFRLYGSGKLQPEIDIVESSIGTHEGGGTLIGSVPLCNRDDILIFKEHIQGLALPSVATPEELRPAVREGALAVFNEITAGRTLTDSQKAYLKTFDPPSLDLPKPRYCPSPDQGPIIEGELVHPQAPRRAINGITLG